MIAKLKWPLAAAMLMSAQYSFALATGFVTPAEVSMTISEIRLLDTSGNTVIAMGSSADVTFKASDADFAQTNFGTISVPDGRYVGAQIGYTTSRKILLSGYKYQGHSGTVVQDGQYVCSAADGSWTAQSTSTCASAAPITITVGGGANRTYFAKTICVATSSTKASVCQDGDTYLDASVASNLTFNVEMDLYNAVMLDGDRSAYDANNFSIGAGNAYPYVSFGGAGAAVHLSSHVDGSHDTGEVTLLFDGSKTLIGSYVFQTRDFSGAQGICDGPSFVTATAAPAGATLNSWGLSYIGQYDSATGMVAFNSNQGSSSITAGMNLLKDIRQVAGTSVQMDCVADSDATSISAWNSAFSAYLGYTYTSFSGNHSATPANIKVVKVTDPNGLFEIATCGKGTTSGCGEYPQ